MENIQIKKIKNDCFKIYLDINKAYISYEIKGNCLIVNSTFVDSSLANQGIASKLYEALVLEVLKHQYQITSNCWFVTKKMQNDSRIKHLIRN